jgi:hypothetical protein
MTTIKPAKILVIGGGIAGTSRHVLAKAASSRFFGPTTAPPTALGRFHPPNGAAWPLGVAPGVGPRHRRAGFQVVVGNGEELGGATDRPTIWR